MVDSTLVHFKTKENFKREKGNIQDTSIAFIKDSKQISTHDTIYNFVNWNVLDDNIVEVPSKYEFVDLGLPSGTLWADRNVGAEKPEDFGLYFAWGETQGYTGITDTKKFKWSDYELCGGSNSTLTKYNNKSSYGTVDNKLVLEQVDDAAYTSDNTCRMPTRAELEELTANTTSTWETLNGVNGRRFTSKTNGNSIFVPVAGECDNSSVSNVGSTGYLWSSSLSESDSRCAWNLYIDNFDVSMYYSNDRYFGYTIRAIKK